MGRSVLELISEIQTGTTDPANTSATDRRACVAYLSAEGYSTPEIAKVLRTCDRTVRRDRERIRADNALTPSVELIPQMVGSMVTEAATSVQRLRRLGREKDAPHAARVEAERAAWQVTKELVQSLQRLGYLPMAIPSFKADLTHRLGGADIPELHSLQRELDRLTGIHKSAGIERPELSEGIDEVRGVLLRLEAGERLAGLNKDVTLKQEANDGRASSWN